MVGSFGIDGTIDKLSESASDRLERAHKLRRLVDSDLVTPRDAEVYAAVTGLTALPEHHTEVHLQHGVGERRSRQIVRAVQGLIDACVSIGGQVGPAQDIDALATVSAEIDLSGNPHRKDAQRAAAALKANRAGTPYRRDNPGGAPVPVANRVRQHRLRRPLRQRIDLVVSDPELSYAQPYLIAPSSLPSSLIDQVPPSQRRPNRPPHEDYLSSLTDELLRSYEERDGRAPTLARIALWGFSRYPISPMPEIEARALGRVALLAREAGGLACYWVHQRIRYVAGDDNPDALLTAADAAIVLRNNGYRTEANRLLARRLSSLQSVDSSNAIAAMARCRILDQLAWNFSHDEKGAPPGDPRLISAAQRYAEALLEQSATPETRFLAPGAVRTVFNVQLTKQRAETAARRERLWLPDDLESKLAAAEAAASAPGEQGLSHAQWTLTRMFLGLLLRRPAEIVTSADRFLRDVELHRWIIRDSPNETYTYDIYRRRALKWKPVLSAQLPPLQVLSS